MEGTHGLEGTLLHQNCGGLQRDDADLMRYYNILVPYVKHYFNRRFQVFPPGAAKACINNNVFIPGSPSLTYAITSYFKGGGDTGSGNQLGGLSNTPAAISRRARVRFLDSGQLGGGRARHAVLLNELFVHRIVLDITK